MIISDASRGADLPNGLREDTAGGLSADPSQSSPPANFFCSEVAQGRGAGRTRSVSVSIPTLATNSNKPPLLKAVVIRNRSERAPQADIHSAQPNTRDFEVGWQLFPALAATGAGRGGQGVRWSALVNLSALNFCGLLTRWSFPRIEPAKQPRGSFFVSLVLSVFGRHGGEQTTGDGQGVVTERQGLGYE